MPTINYPVIVERLREKNREFLDKYRIFVEKNINERLYERETAYARLRLIAKAMLESGAVIKIEDVDILGHSDSIALIPVQGQEPVFLLNDCTDVVVVTGGVASADAISGRIVLVLGDSGSSRQTFVKRYNDVLNDQFNWANFAEELLDTIHSSIYDKQQARRDFLTQGLFSNDK